MAENDSYTPENDTSLEQDLESQDVYTPENDVSLTEDLRSVPRLATVTASATGAGDTVRLRTGTFLLASAQTTGTGATLNVSGGTATLQTSTASATGSGATIEALPRDIFTEGATASGSGDTISISGSTTLDTSTATATGLGGTANVKIPISTTSAQATGTGGTASLLALSTLDTVPATAEGVGGETSFNTIGEGGEITVLIEGQRINTYTNIEIKKRLNEVDTFSFEAFIQDSDDRALIQEGKEIKIIEDLQSLLFKGVLNEVEYKSNFRAKCEGNGMVQKLLNRKTDRDTYSNTAGDQIVKQEVDSSVISYGSIESAPQVSVRFDHDNLARAVAGVANATGYDWYIDQNKSDDFDTDYLNFVDEAGSDTVQQTFEIGNDAMLVERDKDEGFVANDITLLGRGDGINQLQTNVFAATTKYTDTTQVLDENDTSSINVENTKKLIDIEGYNLPNTSPTFQSITGESAYVTDLLFNEDGTLLYEFDETNSTIHKHELSEPFKITSATYTGESVSLSITPKAVTLSNDAETLYIVSPNGTFDIVNSYDLSKPYDIFSLSNRTEDLTLETGSCRGIAFNDSGDKFYQTDGLNSGLDIYVSNLSTPFDLTTATLDTDYSVGASDPRDIGFSDDGTKIYVVDSGTNFKEVVLGSSYDLSTQTGEVNTQVGRDECFVFGDEGKILLMGDSDGEIQEFEVDVPNDELEVRVGSERMNVTVSDASTLSINSRGLNDYKGDSTEQIKHYENVRVWLVKNVTQGIGPFTPNSPEAGSSIDTRGVKEVRSTDKTITDISTLEKTADLELKDRFEDIFRVQVDPTDPRDTKNLSLGDKVNVKDLTAMDVDDTFRITGIDAQRASANEGTTLHLANRPRRLTERLSEIESNTDTLNAHMQGATNFNGERFEDNADNAHPLSNKLFVPEDVVAINKFNLTFARESFRGYVQNSQHSHDVEVNPVVDDTTGERALQHSHTIDDIPDHDHDLASSDKLNNQKVIFEEGNVAQFDEDNPFDLRQNPFGREVDEDLARVDIYFHMQNQTGSSQDYTVEAINEGNSSQIFKDTFTLPDEGTYSTNDYDTNVFAGPNNQENIRIDVYGQNGNSVDVGTASGKAGSMYLELEVLTVGETTSNTQNTPDNTETSQSALGSASTTSSSNAGSPNYGIFEPDTEPDVDVDVKVDGNTVTTINNVSVGDEVSTPIDLKPYLGDPLTGAYHDIELIPIDTGGGNGGRCRLTADVTQKIFIESTL